MTTKVAVVTGSNKGIGFGIVRALCKQFKGDVYLTARSTERGTQAIEDLKKEGLDPKFHQLDITDKSSIETLKNFLVEKYGGLDILVNNAGIAYKGSSTVPFTEQAEVTLKTNFWGNLDACKILFPILRMGARVVNISGSFGHWAFRGCSPELQQRVLSCASIADVEKLMTDFCQAVQAGQHLERGWPNQANAISKLGVTLMSSIYQKVLDADTSRSDLVVNACCPGSVATDMSGNSGGTLDEGAVTPAYLALLPPNVKSPRGEFVRNRKIVPLQ